MGNIFCRQCGTQIGDTDHFCFQCGYALLKKTVAEKETRTLWEPESAEIAAQRYAHGLAQTDFDELARYSAVEPPAFIQGGAQFLEEAGNTMLRISLVEAAGRLRDTHLTKRYLRAVSAAAKTRMRRQYGDQIAVSAIQMQCSALSLEEALAGFDVPLQRLKKKAEKEISLSVFFKSAQITEQLLVRCSAEISGSALTQVQHYRLITLCVNGRWRVLDATLANILLDMAFHGSAAPYSSG